MYKEDLMKHKTDYLTMEEVQTILDKCVEEEDMRTYMLVQVLVRTGRRISEVVGISPWVKVPGLRPCDIHPDGLIEWAILKKSPVRRVTHKGVVRSAKLMEKMVLTKEYKRKLKPVDLSLVKMLKTYIEANGISEYHRVFPFTRQWADFMFKNIVKKTGITRPKQVHLHTLRHTFAINLLKAHPNDASALRQLQMLLDHEDLNTTMEYAQFTPYDQQDMLEKMFNEL